MASKKSAVGISDVGITDAIVPDATNKFVQVIQVALMVPLGDDPHSADCVWGLPTIFWGLSGIAKSARIKQASQTAGLHCEILMPGQRQPEDFSGVLVPVGDGTVRMECMLPGIRVLNKAGRGVLFIDEASCATPATQGAMLGMVNDRISGDTHIAPGVRMLLAANPPKFSAGGWGLEAPMANRMAHFQVRCPSPAEWIAHRMSRGIKQTVDIALSEEKLKNAWGSASSYVSGLFTGFIRDRHTALHNQPLPTNPQSGYNWPSPRTWVMAEKAVATIKALNFDDTLEQLFVEGCVGEGLASEFMNWVKNNDLPRPEQVLEKGWAVDTNKLDVTLAVTSSVTSYVLSLKDQQEQHEAASRAWTFLKTVIDAGIPDISLPAAQALVQAKLARKGHTNAALKKASEPIILWMGKNGMLNYVQTELDQ